jgi:hypothetical protein
MPLTCGLYASAIIPIRMWYLFFSAAMLRHTGMQVKLRL